ncbi:MAG: U32 family peptidase [Deltaproteobacteria bacterium]|nr:U32 family peptidase [Deltaproteobacteria bacterium]
MPTSPPASPPPKPELLAPAGSWESALAALEAGADALYLGLPEWSARNRATNFSLEDLRRLVPLAHGEGRKIYVALNTLLKEDEVPRVAETVWALACQGVDALIIQDLGLWHLCRSIFPEVVLHASTQMAVHSSAGVRQLDAMGFRRAILARECTIPEIQEIHRKASLPLEVFVHGALCFSVSGLCRASGALLGRSANRGLCAQVCRWGFRGAPGKPERHPFSTSDLSLLERVWDLTRAGVSSLKIEGRLKGADYVHGVVRAYRKVLDAPDADREGALGAAREILRAVPGRRATEGYAFHPRPREVLEKGSDPAFGALVGRVVRWKDNTLTLQVSSPVGRGDRLRIQGEGGGQGTALVLRAFRRETVPGGYRLSIPCTDKATRGDRVYRAKSAKGEELEQALTKRLKSLSGPAGLPLELAVGVEDDALTVSARVGPLEIRHAFPMDLYPAQAHPLDKGVLERHLSRLGSTSYYLAKLTVEGRLPPVVIPPSAFKAVRAALLNRVDAALAAEGQRRLEAVRGLRRAPDPEPARSAHLWVRAESSRTLKGAARLPLSGAVAALNRDCLGARDRLAEALGSREKLAWELPAWTAEGDLETARRELEVLAREGYRDLWVTNLAHLELARGLPFRLHGGWELNVLNGWAAAALRALDLRTFVPSPEADRESLGAIGRAGWPLRPIGYACGNLPLFVSRLEPGRQGADSAESADGRRLWWSEAPKPLGRGWTRVYSAEPFSWTGRVGELKALGIGDYLADFQGRPYPEAEVKAALRAIERSEPLPDTTEENYARGLH